jgi:hypothetical protein
MAGVIVELGSQCWSAHAASLLDLPEGLRDLEPWCKVGDTVLYSRHAGKFVRDPLVPVEDQEGAELYVINDDDVIAVLPPQSEWKLNPMELFGF